MKSFIRSNILPGLNPCRQKPLLSLPRQANANNVMPDWKAALFGMTFSSLGHNPLIRYPFDKPMERA